jgi:hypothetical protein
VSDRIGRLGAKRHRAAARLGRAGDRVKTDRRDAKKLDVEVDIAGTLVPIDRVKSRGRGVCPRMRD